MELVPQHRTEMVKLPFVRDQPGCSIQDGLQSSHDNVCGTDRIAGAAEVCRTSTMEGVVGEDHNLEVDTLTDGKPMELIHQHRSDMVKTSLLFQISLPTAFRTDRSLRTTTFFRTVTIAVAIIDTTCS